MYFELKLKRDNGTVIAEYTCPVHAHMDEEHGGLYWHSTPVSEIVDESTTFRLRAFKLLGLCSPVDPSYENRG